MGRHKNAANREDVLDVLILAAELGAISRAAHFLDANEATIRDAHFYAMEHTRELMIHGGYTTYNEALRGAALSLCTGPLALRAVATALTLDAALGKRAGSA